MKFGYKLCLLSLVFALCSCSSKSNNAEQNEPIFDDGVARVVLLFGQSNMEGESYRIHLERRVSKAKFLEYQNGYENIQISYCVPWNPAQQSRNHFVRVALGQGGQEDRFGPEVGLAEYLNDKNYQNVFFVKYSYGGTKLANEWKSPSSGKAGDLYNGAVEYTLNAMKVLENMGYYPIIDAICWMQGESDCDSSYSSYDPIYYTLEKNFISDLRNDLLYYGNPNGIGFIDAGISTWSNWKYSSELNADKEAISKEDDLNYYFSTSDLEYAKEPSIGADNAHYDSTSEIILGQRFGEYAEKFINRDYTISL